MQQPKKICKPTNSQTRGYESCSKENYIHLYGLCSTCFFDWMQTDERGKIYYAKQFKQKVIASSKKTDRAKTKEAKDKLVNWRKKLQTKIQHIARIIDKDLPCLARGTFGGQMHGGHVFAKGGHSTMALNLHNIHRQSAYSNTFKNDDGLLREKLVYEYGEDYLNFIKDINKHPPLKHSNNCYKEIYELACEVANKLLKRDLTYELRYRVSLRNDINVILGIYDAESCIFIMNND